MIKPIVDETVGYKAPIPYALREVKRTMEKGIHFRDNTHGLAGIAGDPHATALHEYGDWAQWAQIPAGNVAERNEGLSNYAKGLTWDAYISKFDTSDERNDGRAQETAALSYIHMENFVEMDELRREAMMTATAAFAALKRPGGGGGGGGGAAMRAEKPGKMVSGGEPSSSVASGPRAYRPVQNKPTAHRERTARCGLGAVVCAANSRRAPPHAVGRSASSSSPHQAGGCGFASP